MKFDLNKPYCRYFNEMLQIPHGSFNEKAVSDWVVAFAKEHDLKYIQDDMYNVVVYKPASKGYENHGAVILQAHLDMVCEKLEEVEHDFLRDPIQTEVVDGWLQAKGTTLGADDGSGIAYMMAVLADKSLKHPALECAFTVQEETGLTGAMNLKKEYFTAKRMINMDCGSDGVTMTSTAGGVMVEMKNSYIIQQGTKPGYSLRISGLLGGHSGGNINKERANALKLTNRIIRGFIKAGLDVQLVSMKGGNKDNAIPRECTAVFGSASSMEDLIKVKNEIFVKAQKEYEASDAGIEIELVEIGNVDGMMSEEQTKKMASMMTVLPTGLRSSSMAIKDLPMASMNFASIKLENGTCIIRYSIRSALESWLELLQDELECYGQQYGFSVESSNHYPAWAYSAKSELRELFAKRYHELTGEELKYAAGHGGTECGVFCDLIEGIDIVTMVAKAEGAHTPQERLNLESFDKSYGILCGFLEVL